MAPVRVTLPVSFFMDYSLLIFVEKMDLFESRCSQKGLVGPDLPHQNWSDKWEDLIKPIGKLTNESITEGTYHPVMEKGRWRYKYHHRPWYVLDIVRFRGRLLGKPVPGPGYCLIIRVVKALPATLTRMM